MHSTPRSFKEEEEHAKNSPISEELKVQKWPKKLI
jgi:hypothetical protein